MTGKNPERIEILQFIGDVSESSGRLVSRGHIMRMVEFKEYYMPYAFGNATSQQVVKRFFHTILINGSRYVLQPKFTNQNWEIRLSSTATLPMDLKLIGE